MMDGTKASLEKISSGERRFSDPGECQVQIGRNNGGREGEGSEGSDLRHQHFKAALVHLRQLVEKSSISKLLQCQTVQKNAIRHLKELNSNEIKESLRTSIESDLEVYTQKDSFSAFLQQTKDASNKEGKKISEFTISKMYLEGLVKKITTYLRNKWKEKAIYNFIHFKWSSQVVQEFSGVVRRGERRQEQGGREMEQNGKQKNCSLEIWNQRRIYELIGKVEDKGLSNQLYIGFHYVLKNMKEKQAQLISALNLNEQLESLLASQIQVISSQKEENDRYNHQLTMSEQELAAINQRCSQLEKEIVGVMESFQNLKKEEGKKGYYVNPMYERNKLEEKYMAEIIQLQSDLFLEKDQSQSLADILIDQTKATHNAFFDLGANRYFISKFDREFYSKVKTLKALDRINLDELLFLKEENEDTECTPNMKRSNISTFSSLELENTMPVVIQECFEPFSESV